LRNDSSASFVPVQSVFDSVDGGIVFAVSGKISQVLNRCVGHQSLLHGIEGIDSRIIVSTENECLEGCSAERETLTSHVDNAFVSHAAVGNVGVLEAGVGQEAGNHGLDAGEFREATVIVGQIDPSEGCVGGKSPEGISERVSVLFDLLLIRLVFQFICWWSCRGVQWVLVG